MPSNESFIVLHEDTPYNRTHKMDKTKNHAAVDGKVIE